MTTEPNVLVLGMGATGTSCARYFASRNALVEFVDTRPTPPGLSSILEIIPEASIHVGSEPVDLSPAIEQIVVSPGVDMESPLIRAGRARGVEIVSDIDLFVDQCQAPIIAVTGSNGKSTVTSMVGVMLSAAGMSPATGGNLGTPALDLLDPDNDIYVLELSSFQLERSRTVPAAASVVLNLTVDHLDRHSDMKSYAAAKARIYNGCRHAVINRDAGEFASLVPDGIPVTTFGLGEPAPGDFGIRTSADGEFIAHGESCLMPVAQMPVPGRHNLSNALAAFALGHAVGAAPQSMVAGLEAFRGLPHRMQVISEANDVLWIDDSKATNIGAAVTSVQSVTDPLVLIAGGDAKDASFRELADVLQRRQCTVVLLGRDKRRMAQEIDGVCDVITVGDMVAAVKVAATLVKPGFTVLLAPACSSQDMFVDFVERGETFAAAVRALSR